MKTLRAVKNMSLRQFFDSKHKLHHLKKSQKPIEFAELGNLPCLALSMNTRTPYIKDIHITNAKKIYTKVKT